MNRRHQAYLSALKYNLGFYISEGYAPRIAYRYAKNAAVFYAFNASGTHLNFITL